MKKERKKEKKANVNGSRPINNLSLNQKFQTRLGHDSFKTALDVTPQ